MKSFLIGLFSIGFLILPALAQKESWSIGSLPASPLALAMGGSGRAFVEKGAEYHLLNPAGIALSKQMQSAGFYVFGDHINPYWGVSISDIQPAPLALSFMKEWDSETQILVLSLAGLILPGWSLGLSIHRQQNSETTNWNGQIGLLIKPKRQNRFAIGTVWDQILPLEKSLENHKKWGIGISYQIHPSSSIQVDTVYHFTKPSHLQIIASMESLLSQFLVLRISGQWSENTRVVLYSGGLGLKGKIIQADYSLSQQVNSNLIHAWTIRTTF